MSQGARTNQGCARCAELESRFRDPATPNPGAFLYAWAAHRLDDHGSTPRPRPDCADCRKFAAGPGATREDVWTRWARSHYMACELAPDWKPERL